MAKVVFDKAQRWYPGADSPAVPGIDLEITENEARREAEQARQERDQLRVHVVVPVGDVQHDDALPPEPPAVIPASAP